MRGRLLATFGIFASLLGIGLFLFTRHNSQPSESPRMLQAFLTALSTAGPADSVEPQYLEATDGTGLAYYAYIPHQPPLAQLLFYHGGGAHSAAGYLHLATRLRDRHQISTILVDIRGHGASKGTKGDAPSVAQVWEDVRSFVQHFRRQQPDVPFFVGGHSSGAGLTLNYATWEKRDAVQGYVLLAPQLGRLSQTARSSDEINTFVTVRTWVFVLSAMTGGRLFGNTPAVFFNYPAGLLANDPGMTGVLTRNMAIAITPHAPQEQFAQLDRPFGLWIGSEDELFLPEAVIGYRDLAPPHLQGPSESAILPNERHLGILLGTHDPIGRWLKEQANGD